MRVKFAKFCWDCTNLETTQLYLEQTTRIHLHLTLLETEYQQYNLFAHYVKNETRIYSQGLRLSTAEKALATKRFSNSSSFPAVQDNLLLFIRFHKLIHIDNSFRKPWFHGRQLETHPDSYHSYSC